MDILAKKNFFLYTRLSTVIPGLGQRAFYFSFTPYYWSDIGGILWAFSKLGWHDKSRGTIGQTNRTY